MSPLTKMPSPNADTKINILKKRMRVIPIVSVRFMFRINVEFGSLFFG